MGHGLASSECVQYLGWDMPVRSSSAFSILATRSSFPLAELSQTIFSPIPWNSSYQFSVVFSPLLCCKLCAIPFCSPESLTALRTHGQGKPPGTFPSFPTKEVQGRVSPISLSHQTQSISSDKDYVNWYLPTMFSQNDSLYS